MKKIIALLTILFLQSCIVNIKQDYNGYSRNLVFEQNKKWLINNIYTDLNSYDRDENKILPDRVQEKNIK